MKNTRTCTGIGLIALDVIMNGDPKAPLKFHVGGSCGNVLTILSFLGWQSYPIGRLAKNKATYLLIDDLETWKVDTSLLSIEETGSTPIIIHRILKDKNGQPKHRFEFRDPVSGEWLPRYKAVISKKVEEIESSLPNAGVYYFDRISRSSIELAKIHKEKGALIVFEPTSMKETKQFKECLALTDIFKFSHDRIREYHVVFPESQAPLEIETRGKEGLRFRFRSNKWIQMKAYAVNKVIDAAGAGDWCTAGLISMLGHGGRKFFDKLNLSKIENALQYGQALGAINCCFDGARGIMYNTTEGMLDQAVEKVQQNSTISLKDIRIVSREYNVAILKVEALLEIV